MPLERLDDLRIRFLEDWIARFQACTFHHLDSPSLPGATEQRTDFESTKESSLRQYDALH